MSSKTKGSITSSFPNSVTNITEQDESFDKASEDPAFAEAKDFNKLGAEIEAIQSTLGSGGRGEVFNVQGDPIHTFDVGSLEYVYQGVTKSFSGATSQSLSNAQDNFIFLIPLTNTLIVNITGFPSTEHIPLARWNDSSGLETFTDERTHDLEIVSREIENDTRYYGSLDKSSSTVLRLSPLSRTPQIVVVNGESVDISSNVDCIVGASAANTINSSGADSGSAPANSTLHHTYLSNSRISAALQNKLRLSTTAPNAKGYLGISGDAKEWRYVGSVFLNGGKQITDEWNVCGIAQDYAQKKVLASDDTKDSGSAGFYELLRAENVVVLEGTVVSAFSNVTQINDFSDTACFSQLGIDGEKFRGAHELADVGDEATTTCGTSKKFSTTKVMDITLESHYDALGTSLLTLGTDSGVERTYFTFTRSTKF